MLTRGNSYKFDNFGDADQEAARLDWRSVLHLDRYIPTMKSAGLTSSMRVLDVGSGTGHRALQLARFASRGSVVGIDISSKLLTRAEVLQRKSKQKNLRFLRANILSPRSLKCLGKFDFIHMRLVTQHLSDPVVALCNLRNILNPGGRIFVEDTDRDWTTLYPCPTRWHDLYSRVQKGQKREGGDPNTGRKLEYYLHAAKFDDIRVNLSPITGDNTFIRAWLHNAVPTYFNYLKRKDWKLANSVFEEIANYCDQGPMFFYQVWCQAYAVVPDARS
jgi:SAM-dependent methyltransferase